MKNIIAALIAILFSASAYAADATPPKAAEPAPAPRAAEPAFVPYSLTEEENKQLMTFLSQQPYSFAAPLISFLGQKEQDARSKAATAKTPPTK